MKIFEGQTVVSFNELLTLVTSIFRKAGIESVNAAEMAKVVVMAEADECRSHGIYRVKGCVDVVKSGKVDPQALFTVLPSREAVVRIDARGGFATAAIQRGRSMALARASQFGVAVLAVNNCNHFSALWADLEGVAAAGFAGFAFTIGRHSVALAGGKVAAFGTNPMAFAFPRGQGKPPFIFDMSSSIVARGEIELHEIAGRAIPCGWGMDPDGEPTTDASLALKGAILPFGGHKGAAIGLMVELLAGPLIGDLTSAASLEIDSLDGGPLRGGYLMIVIDPAAFSHASNGVSAADDWLSSISIRDPSARLPSARRYTARARSKAKGIMIDQPLFDQLCSLL